MRLVAVALVAAALGAGQPSGFAQDKPFGFAQDRQTFRSGIDVTGITVSVRDADGHHITDLTRADFDIYEDGEKQDLSQLTNYRVPASRGALLDISDSMFVRRIADARAAATPVLRDQLPHE